MLSTALEEREVGVRWQGVVQWWSTVRNRSKQMMDTLPFSLSLTFPVVCTSVRSMDFVGGMWSVFSQTRDVCFKAHVYLIKRWNGDQVLLLSVYFGFRSPDRTMRSGHLCTLQPTWETLRSLSCSSSQVASVDSALPASTISICVFQLCLLITSPSLV